jgi:hypothetical protein
MRVYAAAATSNIDILDKGEETAQPSMDDMIKGHPATESQLKLEDLKMSGSAFHCAHLQIFKSSNQNHCLTIVFPAITTVPVLARALPSSVAPVLNVMDSIAMTVPLKTEVVPKVAELPTCQKMFEATAPPARMTLRPDVVVSVDAI